MIFNIRGTSGSGKSHIVHHILNNNKNTPCIDVPGAKEIGYYIPSMMTRVLGRYAIACGGCDQISSQDEICGKIRRLKHPNLIFEGLLVSHSFNRYHLLAQKSGPIIFCFLNTSPEKCIERVYQRRKAAGKLGTFNELQIYKDHKAVDRCKEKFIDHGHTVYELDSENSVKNFMGIFYDHMESGEIE